MAEHTYVIGTKEFKTLTAARKYAQEYANEDDRPITITHEIRPTDRATRIHQRVLGYSASHLRYGKDIVVSPKRKRNPGNIIPTTSSSWIPVHAIRKTPDGDIQVMVEKGTLNNPSKKKKVVGQLKGLFGQAKKVLGLRNPNYKYEILYSDELGRTRIFDTADNKKDAMNKLKKAKRLGDSKVRLALA